MSGGWGKKAATRIGRTQFDNDELLKSLGSQFNVDFTNYDQWQRSSRNPKSPTKESVFGDDSNSFIVSRVKSADSTCFKHSSFREKRQAAKQVEKEREVSERVKILELRITTRTKTCGEYQRRCKELLDENLKLSQLIDNDESTTHDGVKKLLRKYERYRGGIATLNSNFVKELEEAKEDLELTKLKIAENFQSLDNQVTELNKQLQEKQDEFKVLLSYKDKEYPVKAMKIANLHTQIDHLKLSNNEDRNELEHIVNTELGKYEKHRTQTSNEIRRNVTEKALKMLHPSLEDMALQNMVMSNEIEFHQHQQAELEENCSNLQKEVKRILRDNKTNTKLQMFPEFFNSRPKCTPEMEVVLDIPTHQWLPI